MKIPTYAPVYAAIYPDLATIARNNGYALAVHGSLQRDFDLIAIPWSKDPNNPKLVVEEIVNTFALSVIGEMEEKLHGRMVWTISIGFGECFMDLSFMPLLI